MKNFPVLLKTNIKKYFLKDIEDKEFFFATMILFPKSLDILNNEEIQIGKSRLFTLFANDKVLYETPDHIEEEYHSPIKLSSDVVEESEDSDLGFNIFSEPCKDKEVIFRSAKDELVDYLKQKERPSLIRNFWVKNKDKWPNLSKSFFKSYTIFISNGKVERSFSRLKFMLDWRKNRTKIELIEKRMVLREFLNK